MFTSMFFYLFICLLLFGIGDVLGVATKAKVSAVFVSLMLFLLGFMTGVLPPDIIKLAGLTDVGKWSLIFVVFSMGTSLNIKQLIAEWRTVAVAVLSMIVLIVGSVVLIPVIGYQETIVSIPIINGGIVATQIMTSAAMDKGFAMAAALGTVLYAVQKFFGTPVASYFGLRAAKEALAEFRSTGVNPYAPKEEVHGGAAPKETFFEKHKKFYGPFASLTIAAFFSWLAFVIGKYTGLSATIWALILGAAMGSTGLVPPKILDHAKSSGIFNVGVFAVIIPSLAKIKVSDLLVLSFNTIIPAFMTKDGQAVSAFGIMGGFMQPQAHVQVAMNMIDFGLNPQQALDAPRWQWIGGKTVEVEQDTPNHIIRQLQRMGHNVVVQPDPYHMGRGQIIIRDEDGVLCGATEKRTDGQIACF